MPTQVQRLPVVYKKLLDRLTEKAKLLLLESPKLAYDTHPFDLFILDKEPIPTLPSWKFWQKARSHVIPAVAWRF